eukprot:scaffold26902_cov65-Phaeocystis_antarctica.AAC.2
MVCDRLRRGLGKLYLTQTWQACALVESRSNLGLAADGQPGTQVSDERQSVGHSALLLHSKARLTADGRSTKPGEIGRDACGTLCPTDRNGSCAFIIEQLTICPFAVVLRCQKPSCVVARCASRSSSRCTTTPADAGSSLDVPARKRALSALTTSAL